MLKLYYGLFMCVFVSVCLSVCVLLYAHAQDDSESCGRGFGLDVKGCWIIAWNKTTILS